MFHTHETERSPSTKDIITLLNMGQIPLGGLNSGVPTRTTATLTPTTLRNVEQTSLELQCQVESHQNQAGFVPPVVQPSQGIFMSVVDTKSWQGGLTRVSEARSDHGSSILDSEKSVIQTAPRKNLGGRKPNKEMDISPEEEERRAVRRERNKMAAARCRKRRLDHTNELIEETEELEEKKLGLQNEIMQLQLEKEELESLLDNHKPCCRLRSNSPPDVKPNINEIGVAPAHHNSDSEMQKPSPLVNGMKSHATLNFPKKRPDSLPVMNGPLGGDIPITTPTNGINFNFESLMEGGTGLTPVSAPLVPSCSSQLRNSDLSSPDSNKLVAL